MKFLRRISTRHLLALCTGAVLFAAAVAGIAVAVTGGGPKPPPKALPAAVHEALTAPAVSGVSGRIEFTNHLISGSTIQGGDPLLTGASGRFWASSDGRLRIELQSDISDHGGGGDVQILVDGSHVTLYDANAGNAYEATLPQRKEAGAPREKTAGPPTIGQISKAINRLSRHSHLSGAIPSDVAGQPTYTVQVAPKQNGGLLGGAQLAWDSVHGTPLRAAVYAKGDSSPVLELKVTDVSFGSVPSSVFDVSPPSGTKITHLSAPSKAEGGSHAQSLTGLAAVTKNASFPVAAPASLAGMNRGEVRQVSSGKHDGVLVTYGQGLGGIAVLELPTEAGRHSQGPGGQSQLNLPHVSVNGASGQELETALGTVISFKRGNVEYVVAGSVPGDTALAAARGI